MYYVSFSLLSIPCEILSFIGPRKKHCFVNYLKGHSQLTHMRIRYHFLADLHVTRHTRETGSEKRIRNTQPCRVELVTSPNRDYRP